MIEELKSKAENVAPCNYHVHKIIYTDGYFLIAWGQGKDKTMRIAKRWNGENHGYPSLFDKEVWFQLPEYLSLLMLRSILGIEFYRSEEIIKVIRDLANGKEWDRQIEKSSGGQTLVWNCPR